MMPMRRIFSFAPVALEIACRAAAWVAMSSLCLSERGVRDAVQDLGDEVLLQLLPVVVDGRLLVEEKRFGLLDFTLDPDLLGDSIDLLATGPFFDLDLGCGIGGRGCRGRGTRRRLRRRARRGEH